MNNYSEFGKIVKENFDRIVKKKSTEDDEKRSNANINGDAPMGELLQMGTSNAKEYYLDELIDPKIAELHRNGDIHIHDLDLYALTETCAQIDLKKLFENGFSTGHGFLRKPNSIGSYAALTAIAIQSNQSDMHGGQSIPALDYFLADGVECTYQKYLVEAKSICGHFKNYDDEWVHDYAMKKTERDTYQAMEGLIHNLNTLNSRAGAQVPFSSINLGTCTSWAGRMVTKQFLLATEAGLGKGETPIFPVSIFKVKDGVNYNAGDPNYDLFKLAIRVSAKRMFPNFSFIDAPMNLPYYQKNKPETEIAYMGCRTRVIGNVYDRSREIVFGRGNLSFTTINLPRLAIESMIEFTHTNENRMQIFYRKLDNILEMTLKQLLDRYAVQAKRHVYNYPFLMGQGVWIDSEKLNNEQVVGEILKHGTLSIGFVGLAETLKCLIGKHHGESKVAQQIGLEIVEHMRDFCDRKSEELQMNVTCLATPAESTAGRFVKLDQKKYGCISGVTDREYYTNSFHVPVYYNINAVDKIDIEAPYHALTNAGHITYIELDGDPTKNLEAYEAIIRHMKEAGIGYGAINHPIDRDPVCGFNGIIQDECPLCHRKEHNKHTERIKRIRKG